MQCFICPGCGVEKPVSDFRKKMRAGPLEPWNLRQCKQCTHEEYRRYRSIPKFHKRRLQRASRWKDANPEEHARHALEYRQRHPAKIIAQNRLNHAIRTGKMQRQPCAVCGTTDRVHAHHHSYAPEDWYNVRWLCYVCHKIEHTEPTTT